MSPHATKSTAYVERKWLTGSHHDRCGFRQDHMSARHYDCFTEEALLCLDSTYTTVFAAKS